MDVSFTNVLEGARQYFQGLPTVSCSTANNNSSYPAAGERQTNSHYAVEQNQDRTTSATSYWPPHQDNQLRPPTRDRVSVDSLQRPPSHQPETPRPSSHNQSQLQEQLRTSTNYHAQTAHQEQSVPTSHSFQFSRPHSRDVQQHVAQQQQYQSHILPNPSYHQSAATQQTQPRAPTRIQEQASSMSSQTYHQMQQPQSHAQQNHNQQQQQSHNQQQTHSQQPSHSQQTQQPQNHSQPYPYQQQSRSYYPTVHTQTQQQQQQQQQQQNQSQSQSYHHSYQVASSQAYSQPQEPSYVHQSYASHSQNSYPTDNYATTKSSTAHTQEVNHLKENQSSQQQAPQQQYRTTHNLPPIAALSSLNYHSNRSSREAMRIASNKTRTPTSIPSSTSYSAKPIAEASAASRVPPMQYSLHSSHNEYTNNVQANRSAVSQAYQYTTAGTTQSNSQFASTSGSLSSATSVQHQSSTSNYPTHPNYAAAVQEGAKTYQTPTSKVIQQTNNSGIASVLKQKRESPLDLSVKTVRTSADSTLDDTDAGDVQRINKYYQTGRPPMHSPMQAPTVSYPTYDVYANSFQRNLAGKSTQLSTPSATGAPKVDFFPNFNIPAMTQNPSGKVDNRRPPYEGLNQRQGYDRKNMYQQIVSPSTNAVRHPVSSAMPAAAHVNSNSVLQSSAKKPMQGGLPRIDFLPPSHKTAAIYAAPTGESQRKRTPEQVPAIVPSKIPKVDVWRQTIDQQIEQRLSSYAKSRLQQEQIQKQPNKQLVNGNYSSSMTHDRAKDLYSSTYHRPQYNTLQTPQPYTNTNQYNVQSHNQTYVPTASAHQYPGYTNQGSQQQQQAFYASQQQQQQQQSLSRASSNPSLPITSGSNRNNVGGADRRVLSLLRNSLEIKGAKEAQKKLEQEQHKPQDLQPIHHARSDVQQPSTDVMAPLQPKPGVVGRHNMSPFAATSLFDRNSSTPPTYKFHLPKAIDSIKFDTDITKDCRISDKIKHTADGTHHPTITNPNSDLDGLAAFLAARIRTKAELKQVGPAQNYNNNSANLIRSSSETQLSRPVNKTVECSPSQNSSNGGSPPKLTREQRVAYPPRRRLFSRNEEDLNGPPISNVPPRDKSGLRSSSETSVFDFPDSDSETEMPVLERQSLVDMRRDRKAYPKVVASEEGAALGTPAALSPLDISFDDACDKFMEQLKGGVGKKRGRRKKVVEPDVLAKLETVVTQQEMALDKPVKIEVEVKKEVEDVVVKQEPPVEKDAKTPKTPTAEPTKPPKIETDSDSDVPLIKCKVKPTGTSDAEESTETIKMDPPPPIKTELPPPTTKSEIVSEGSSESESEETIKKISDKLKQKHKASSGKKDAAPTAPPTIPPTTTPTPTSAPTKTTKKGKPVYGDGTDFHPGWEEEVYKYKRSLRMPAALIHVTRPPQWHRLSTSLPDLDPCPNSPSLFDNTTKIKNEPVDSDIDSNSNFSFSFGKNYDSEEGSSSVKSINLSSSQKKNNTSILDRLMERCGARKRKRLKKKNEEGGPKIVPKSEKELELLSTPSLEVKAQKNRKEQIIKEESVFLGFRKKTIDNFKESFISNSNSLIGINEQFKTVVLKSRTRLETRAMKQKATIKEVFGEDRPASAPPVTCVDNTVEDAESKPQLNITFSKDDSTPNLEGLKVSSILENTKEVLKNKLLNRGRKGNANLLKSITTKKMISEYTDDDIVIKRDLDSKSETPSIDGDDYTTPARKRMKNMRRKFSSGFDYIRKKKKQVKKEGIETEATAKPKRRGFVPKTSPESVQDIQKEIKMWVMNKGIGETHLHRAARLGYTDITAYCLEKMEGSPSPKDNAGYTPLHEACARGHLSIARLLLVYGANVSESAQGGIRPLHEAAENGFVEIVRLLLSYGADPMLATYSGLTPLSLATEEATVNLLQNHIADIQGQPSAVWNFLGPAPCFDAEESGYNPLEDIPSADPLSEDEDVEFELSEAPLPNLYTIRGESQTDRWVLLQDLSNILKIKSRDALLRQISPAMPSTSANSGYKSVLRELKMADFLEQASCCQYLCAGEKINTRASKIALVRYSDNVRQLLGVEKDIITER